MKLISFTFLVIQREILGKETKSLQLLKIYLKLNTREVFQFEISGKEIKEVQ